jgi:hypothetical protein
MKILVCIKQVPDTKKVTGQAMKADGTVNRAALPAIFNPEARNALDAALRVKDECGGSVTVVTMGLPSATAILREALMCGADRAVATDIEEAWICGRRAVELALEGKSGVMVTMDRVSNDPYKIEYSTAPLDAVAVEAKPMPAEFVDAENLYVTDACIEYLRPLIGELPKYVKLF